MKAASNCGTTGIKIYSGFTCKELFPLAKAAKAEGLKIWGHTAFFPAQPKDVAEAGMEVIPACLFTGAGKFPTFHHSSEKAGSILKTWKVLN